MPADYEAGTWANTPEGSRLMLVAVDLLSQLGSRTSDGYAISAEWGEPDERGWYEPTFTIDYDDRLDGDVRHALSRLVTALTTPLPDDEAEDLDGINQPWTHWYPEGTIVNSPKAKDTGPRIVARIFAAIDNAKRALE
jgi:hypothetical protein